jgi:DNA adenine methylase
MVRTLTPTRPILRYHGGKWLLADWLIGFFPAHRVYVEPYGGAASVLLQKPRSYAEVYNDLDEEVVNLFRVARERGDELQRALTLTPFARQEYEEAWHPSNDPLEQARRTVIRSFMGFGSAAVTMKRRNGTKGGQPGTGFRANSNRSGTTPAHDWRNYAGTGFRTYTGDNRQTIPSKDWETFGAALAPIIERLRGVVIENKDAFEVMRDHDCSQALHYVDPPYPLETRDAGVDYRYEMTSDQHRELAGFLGTLQGAVVISGYPCDLYEEIFSGWVRREKAALADGARARVEVVWLNHKASQHTRGLFG